jgi:hypothetical protein
MASGWSVLRKGETTVTGRGEARRGPRRRRIISVPNIWTGGCATLTANISLPVVNAVPGVADIRVPGHIGAWPRRGDHGLPWAPTKWARVVGLGCTCGQHESAAATQPDNSVPAMVRFRLWVVFTVMVPCPPHASQVGSSPVRGHRSKEIRCLRLSVNLWRVGRGGRQH